MPCVPRWIYLRGGCGAACCLPPRHRKCRRECRLCALHVRAGLLQRRSQLKQLQRHKWRLYGLPRWIFLRRGGCGAACCLPLRHRKCRRECRLCAVHVRAGLLQRRKQLKQLQRHKRRLYGLLSGAGLHWR